MEKFLDRGQCPNRVAARAISACYVIHTLSMQSDEYAVGRNVGYLMAHRSIVTQEAETTEQTEETQDIETAEPLDQIKKMIAPH